MAENEEGQEKTEPGTGKRREEAREKGQVARSQELVSVGILVACLIYFYFGTSGLLKNIMELLSSGFRDAGKAEITSASINGIFAAYVFKGFIILFPLMITVVVAAILCNVFQVGLMFSSESIEPKLSKIDPIGGIKRLFSLRSIIELIKNLLKICIVGTVAYLVIKKEQDNVFTLVDQSVWGTMVYLGGISFKIVLTVTIVLIALAILDYIYQRWEYEKGLRMTKQEVKDEFKNTEGDPLIKSRIRRLQLEAARKRMMAAVPKADVVITNPTHLAVAIKYDPDNMQVPVVVAKGADYIAEKIRQIAQENDVPMVENKPLAQVLYKLVKVNDAIPETVYRAVAEVLAYVYDQKKVRIFG